MIGRVRQGIHIVLVTTAMASPVHADEKVLRAMSSLIASAPPSQQLPVTVVDGSLVIENRSAELSFVGVFAPGPGLCIVRFQGISQRQGEWAEATTVAFDFTKLQQIRWLADTDDASSAPSRQMDDDKVRRLAIDGKTLWLCRDDVQLSQQKEAYKSACAKTWTVNVPTPADRAAAVEAVELIKKSCVAAK